MSKEQTAEEILNKHLKLHGVVITKIYTKYLTDVMEEYATLKLQEQAKEIEYQQQVMNTQAEKIVDMNAEIERLKGENEKLASVISDVIRKHSIKDDIDFNY